MRRLWPLLVFIAIFFLTIWANSQKISRPTHSQTDQRIISLAPSITETLFALGAGENVVAVSDFCDFPQQVQDLPKVGNLLSPNLEAIVQHQPDLVILSDAQSQTQQQLQRLQIPTLVVAMRTVDDIKSSITDIGHALAYQQQARSLVDKINNGIYQIQQKYQHQATPRVMVSIGHTSRGNDFTQIFIAGQHDFYNDLIELANGKNVYQRSQPAVPSLSIEGVLQLNPDIIIDIFPDADDHHMSLKKVRQQWKNLQQVKAVQNDQVYLLEADYATIPGPRIVALLEQFVKFIHSDAETTH